MSNAPVELVGNFESAEARFLRSQFDDCRIELMARSLVDRRTALLRWQPSAGIGAPALQAATPSVTDRRRRPPVAWYVLEHDPDLHLTPIRAGPELHDRYPGHFPAAAVPDQPARKGCLPFGRWLLPVIVTVAPTSD